MTQKLTRLSDEQVIEMNPTFGVIGRNLEWRRCGTPSDGFSRGVVVRFTNDDAWFKLDGKIVADVDYNWTWSDGAPIERPS